MNKVYCSNKDDIKYAGTQLIIELWGGISFDSLPKIKEALLEAVKATETTILKMDLHEFSPSGGVSGMVIIQESHFSIHTWPEYKYAAIDIFVCGDVNPYKAIPVFKKHFKPKNIQIAELKRGIF